MDMGIPSQSFGRTVICCEQCGGALIHRLSDGSLEFVFGKGRRPGEKGPVNMRIKGTVRIKCFRAACHHWNTVKSGIVNDEVIAKPL